MKRTTITISALAAALALAASTLVATRASRPVERAAGPAGPGGIAPAPTERAAPTPVFEVADDPAGGLRLEGLVLDVEGGPVAGAWVAVDARPPRRAQTVDDGSFAFDGLVEGAYAVTAFHADAVAGPVQTLLTASSEPVILRSRPAAKAAVVVIDARTQAAVADAEVVVRGSIALATTTDARGVAAFDAVADGAHTVDVAAAGYAPARAQLFVAGGAGTHVREVIALETGAAVSGRVIAEDGSPVAGARVALLAEGETSPLAETDSEDDGSWRFAAAPAGRHYVVVDDDRFVRGRSELVALDGRSARDGIVIQLAFGGLISGRVVSSLGRAVPYARVRLRHRTDPSVRRQVSADAMGMFDIVGLPAGKLELVALASDAASAVTELELPADTLQRNGVEIALELEDAIAGVVRGADGDVVAQAEVRATLVSATSLAAYDAEQRGELVALSDSGGRFRLRGLVPGVYELRAHRPGGSLPPGGQRARTGDDEVVLAMAGGGRVRGRVVYRDGSPVGVFQVAVGRLAPKAFVTADGRFEIDDCAPGEQRVAVKGPTFPTAAVQVTVLAGRERDVGAIEVGVGRRVAGRVVDASGAPVPGALVSVGAFILSDGSSAWQRHALGQGRRNVTADPAGQFEFIGLGAEELAIVGEHPAHGRSADRRIPAGGDDVSLALVLVETGVIEGRVSLGGRASQAIVTAAATGSRAMHQTVALDDGSYRFTRVSPGSYVVTASYNLDRGQSVSGRSTPVEVASGQVRTVDVDAPLGDAVVRIVVDSRGPGEWLAQVYLAPGAFEVTRAVDLEAALANAPSGDTWVTGGRVGQPFVLRHVSRGVHTACALRIAASAQDGGDTLRDDPDALAARCATVDVRAGTNEVVLVLGAGGEG
jgi:protocatechuate 3,4-dioxygenase beta subunit